MISMISPISIFLAVKTRPKRFFKFNSLLSNLVTSALIDSNFQLDVGSFTLNFSCNSSNFIL